jgi:hypothetical protein
VWYRSPEHPVFEGIVSVPPPPSPSLEPLTEIYGSFFDIAEGREGALYLIEFLVRCLNDCIE